MQASARILLLLLSLVSAGLSSVSSCQVTWSGEPAQSRNEHDLQFEASKFIAQVDTQFESINRIFSSVLFYDFGMHRLTQFGAADIRRQPANQYFGFESGDVFITQIPSAMADYKDRYGRTPESLHDAYEAIAAAGVALPPTPTGVAYAFDAATQEFMVEARGTGVPFIAAWLLLGGVFLTARMHFINLRGILHAFALLSGKYDDATKHGQLTHYRSFTASFASTVGLGATGGVAVAVCAGGPGAAFWIMVCGLLGMSTKFTECVLGQIYRRVSADGVVLGGPMHYLKAGFKLRKFLGLSMAPFGTLLSWTFAVICVCVSVIAGNALPISQSLGSLQTIKGLEFLQVYPWIYGAFMVLCVAAVVFGGIKSLGRVTGFVSPLMCLTYIGACGYVIAMNFENAEAALKSIFVEAFQPQALFAGSLVGVMIIGVTHASLNTDAGRGTASIIHAAAQTDEPVREGLISMLEPFVVSVLMCLLTALALGVTGVASTVEGQALASKDQGTALVLSALTKGLPAWFSYLLHAIIVLFTFTSCVTWAYFGERCFVYLLGGSCSRLYNCIFILFTFLGSVVSAANVMQFSLLLTLTLAIPNLIGVLLLNTTVREELDDYWQHYRTPA